MTPLLDKVAANLGLEPDDLKLIVSMIRLPKNPETKRNHALCIASACSPLWNGQLGLAGGVLWRKGLVEHMGAKAMPLLLLLRNTIERRDEAALSAEVLSTWESFS